MPTLKTVCLAAFLLMAAHHARAAEEVEPPMDNAPRGNAADRAEDRTAIGNTVALYVDGHRKGAGAVMKPAFHPSALVFLGPKAEPVQTFLDLIDTLPPAPETAYEVVFVDVAETIGMARVELFNVNGMRFSDMFTLVKTEEGWKIACKISHRHP